VASQPHGRTDIRQAEILVGGGTRCWKERCAGLHGRHVFLAGGNASNDDTYTKLTLHTSPPFGGTEEARQVPQDRLDEAHRRDFAFD
jgi:hypothetical protein